MLSFTNRIYSLITITLCSLMTYTSITNAQTNPPEETFPGIEIIVGCSSKRVAFNTITQVAETYHAAVTPDNWGFEDNVDHWTLWITVTVTRYDDNISAGFYPAILKSGGSTGWTWDATTTGSQEFADPKVTYGTFTESSQMPNLLKFPDDVSRNVHYYQAATYDNPWKRIVTPLPITVLGNGRFILSDDNITTHEGIKQSIPVGTEQPVLITAQIKIPKPSI